jgi:hypothetical protein
MGSEAPSLVRKLRAVRGAALAALACGAWALAGAQGTSTSGGIYTCIDSKGRRLTADRPISECSHKEQQLLNRDGSVRSVIPPTMTAEERAEKEARDRVQAEARAAQADAVRRDRNLVARYPNEAAHNRAREAAADTVRLAMKASEIRLRELEAARKPLRDEAEFYQGKSLPAKLKAAIDANEASVEAQRSAAANQEAELVRINRIYDAELDRLRRLWGGAQAGSLGPIGPVAGPGSAPASPRPAPSPKPGTAAPR